MPSPALATVHGGEGRERCYGECEWISTYLVSTATMAECGFHVDDDSNHPAIFCHGDGGSKSTVLLQEKLCLLSLST